MARFAAPWFIIKTTKQTRPHTIVPEFHRLRDSLKGFNYRLYFSLVLMNLSPAIYMSLRIFWLSTISGLENYTIAGQLIWVSLIYAIFNESILLPLHYFMGIDVEHKERFSNKVRTGLFMCGNLYLNLSIIIMIFAEPLLGLMAVHPDIIRESAIFIRLESVANIFAILVEYTLVSLVALGKDKDIYGLTIVRLLLIVFFDTFFVSNLFFSANLGVYGIPVTNIVVNMLLFIISLILIRRHGIKVFCKENFDFHWVKEYFKDGMISGLESAIRNLFYIFIIIRMMNDINELGTYWVANSFIFTWLLLPISSLGEVIRRETAEDPGSVHRNFRSYVFMSLLPCVLWFIFIPLYQPFMHYVLQFGDYEKLFRLVMVLIGFYVLYALKNICESIFYGLGKIHYKLFQTMITNFVYYGICLALYLAGVFTPTLQSVAIMFGCGLAFDAIVSYCAFFILHYRIKHAGTGRLAVHKTTP